MKNYTMQLALCIGLCFSIGISQNDPQIRLSRSKFSMNVSYSRFRYTNTESYLEVSYAFYPSLVTLLHDSVAYKGIVDFQTVIRNTEIDSVIVNQPASLPIILSDTSAASVSRPLLAKLTFAVPKGSYRLEVRAQDRLNPSRRDSMMFPLNISTYIGETSISDVDLCSNITESKNKDNHFYKNSYEVYVNPSLFFGSSAVPVIFTYTELYNLKLDSPYILKMQIVDGRGQLVKERTRPRRYKIIDAVDVSTFPVTNIVSGKYRFCLLLTDSLGNKISSVEKVIYIYNPKVESSTGGFISALSADLAGLSDDELTNEFRKAHYIGYTEDTKMFSKLSTVEGKREFLAKFWASIENGQRGRTDLTRAIYLDRVTTSNQRYHAMGKEGWQTDRGRVYLLYAEPDEVERFPSESNSKPYEVWHYNQIESGVIFVFIDRTGFGEYTLVHSTKRGEIQDDSWQQYLR
jgi:GWxTD domain-containing protein